MKTLWVVELKGVDKWVLWDYFETRELARSAKACWESDTDYAGRLFRIVKYVRAASR